MKTISVVLSGLLLAATMVEAGQDVEGRYITESGMGTLRLNLRDDGNGMISGDLAGDEGSYLLQGTMENGVLTGELQDETYFFGFRAEFTGPDVLLILYELDWDGSPIEGTQQSLLFTPYEGEGPESSADVIINGIVLSAEAVAELESTYGVRPLPGDYWYDAVSGLYGVEGYPSYGFMRPGHELGPLKPDASRGNTGVYVNGRELPVSEYAVWSAIVGAWIQPGRYWLDSRGNAGYEGTPEPAINLYAAAAQRNYGGQRGTGDNFWSTRFSAGNSNADNSQGYVSVPGYGPVGYGF